MKALFHAKFAVPSQQLPITHIMLKFAKITINTEIFYTLQ